MEWSQEMSYNRLLQTEFIIQLLHINNEPRINCYLHKQSDQYRLNICLKYKLLVIERTYTCRLLNKYSFQQRKPMFKLLEIEREQDNRVAKNVYKGELFSSLVGRQSSAAVAWQRQHRGLLDDGEPPVASCH